VSWQLASFALLGIALAGGFGWYERSRPSSRTVALVAALAALATLGRLAFAPLPNVKPTTDIVLIAGYVLGGAPGFTVGAVSAIASNIVLSEGPWTPWQMAAWGLVGIAGALLGRWRRPIGRVPMALICALAGFGYGFILDLYTWLGFSDHSAAQYLAVEASAFAFNLAHALGNFLFYLAFGPMLVRALRRFRARMDIDWGPREAPATLLVVILAVVCGATLSSRQDVASAAAVAFPEPARAPDAGLLRAPVGYLVHTQDRDGGWGFGPGQAANQEATAWAVIGLVAAGGSPAAIERGTAWMRDHLDQLQGAGDIERTILALAPARAPLGTLIAQLDGVRRKDGSFGEQANLTAFAILALRAAAAPLPAGSLAFLEGQQNGDGGFSFGVRGDPSDVDDSAGALEALVAAHAPALAVGRARAYLLAHEDGDGGYPLESGEGSNAQSTAWAVQALLAAGGPVERPLAYLRARTQPDGTVAYAAGTIQTPVWVTGEALAALARAPLPLTPAAHAAR
jgi:energy-coupling factor transport system substrate-specific component